MAPRLPPREARALGGDAGYLLDHRRADRTVVVAVGVFTCRLGSSSTTKEGPNGQTPSATTPTLSVCHGDDGGPRFHPCRRVQEAMRAKDIAYEKVVAAHGSPIPILRKGSREQLRAATGDTKLPALKLSDSMLITHSRAILAWVNDRPLRTDKGSPPCASPRNVGGGLQGSSSPGLRFVPAPPEVAGRHGAGSLTSAQFGPPKLRARGALVSEPRVRRHYEPDRVPRRPFGFGC